MEQIKWVLQALMMLVVAVVAVAEVTVSAVLILGMEVRVMNFNKMIVVLLKMAVL
jgi:hypothetical protein